MKMEPQYVVIDSREIYPKFYRCRTLIGAFYRYAKIRFRNRDMIVPSVELKQLTETKKK